MLDTIAVAVAVSVTLPTERLPDSQVCLTTVPETAAAVSDRSERSAVAENYAAVAGNLVDSDYCL